MSENCRKTLIEHDKIEGVCTSMTHRDIIYSGFHSITMLKINDRKYSAKG